MLLVAHRTPKTASGCVALAEAGARVFEVDVQLRRGTLVVSHFLPFLNVRGWLEHDNGRFRWRSGPPRDASLHDTIGLIPPHCDILLDPKETDAHRPSRVTEELIRQLPDRDRFRVSTDRQDDLALHRAAGFRTWRTIKSDQQLRDALGSGPLPDAGVSVRHTLLDEATVEQLHRVTDTVVAWTVNDVTRAVQLRALGADGVTTDSADVMAAVAG